MTKTDDKTPSQRPPAPESNQAAASAAAASESDDLANHPRDLAAYVRGLPTKDQLTALEARIEDLAGKLARFAEKISELLLSHEEIVSAVDRHADRLTAINSFIEELSKPPAMRRDAQIRTLPATKAGEAHELTAANPPGMPRVGTLPATKPGEPHELRIDPKKVGTTVAKLPNGQEVEINVRRPGPTMRDGRPAAGKVRRS